MHDDEAYELDDSEIEDISGGAGMTDAPNSAKGDSNSMFGCPPCPECGSTNTRPYPGFPGLRFACDDCYVAFD